MPVILNGHVIAQNKPAHSKTSGCRELSVIGCFVGVRKWWEHDGFTTVNKYTSVNMRVNSSCKNDAFHIPSQGDIICSALGVSNTDNVLLDDWAFIQVGGDIMRCCTNQLYAPAKSLMIGITALKRGKERVVNVNNAA